MLEVVEVERVRPWVKEVLEWGTISRRW